MLPIKKIFQKKSAVIFLIIILIATAIAYASCLGSQFVNWDDPIQVTDNLDIRQLTWPAIHTIFTNFYTGMYQPLATLSFAIEYKFWHNFPLFLHLDNILLHLLNLILVYLITKKLFKKDTVALIAVALFGLHPLQVETVAWISARSNLIMAAGFLLALLFYLKYSEKPKIFYYCLSVASFLLCLLAKVQLIALPFILLLLDYYRGRKLGLKAWLEKLPFFALSLAFGLIAIKGRNLLDFIPAKPDITIIKRLLLMPYSLFFYWYKTIWPQNLCTFYPFPKITHGWLPPIFYISAVLLIIIIACLIIFQRRSRLTWFMAGFYFLLIITTLQFKFFSNTLVAERYGYIPLLAAFWLAGLGFEKLIAKFPDLKKLFIIGLILILFIFSAITKMRTWDWYDSRSLWLSVADIYPEVEQSYINIGNTYREKGDHDTALAYYNKALSLAPDDPTVYNDIGASFAENKRDYREAVKYYTKAISAHGNELRTDLFYYNRGTAWAALGQLNLALEDLTMAIKFNRETQREFVSFYSYSFYFNLGNVQYRLKNYQEAINNYNQALQAYNNIPEAYYFRGISKIKLKNITDGCQDLYEADKMKVSEAPADIKNFCK